MSKNTGTINWLAAVIAISGASMEEDEAFVAKYLAGELKKTQIKKIELAKWLEISRPTLDVKLKGTSPFTFVEVVQILVAIKVGYLEL